MILMSLALALCLLTVGASADETPVAHSGHDGWTEWKDSGMLPTENGKYVLTKDIKLKAPALLEGKEITICLDGKNMTQNAPEGACNILWLYYATVLTLCDCIAQTDGNGAYTAGKLTGAFTTAVLVDGGSTLNLYDGKITGNSVSGSGAGVVQRKPSQKSADLSSD